MHKQARRTAIVLRHLNFEDLGSFESVLLGSGYRIRYVETCVADLADPSLHSADLLIVLGGPVGVYEQDRYFFLRNEIALLQQRLGRDQPTLGICLGAQLIAHALGANVYPGPCKEIGWSALQLTPEGATTSLRHLDQTKTHVLHWHGDTFDLPPGARLLASSLRYERQAFAYGQRVLALQFHPEVTASGLEHWFVGHSHEISSVEGLNVKDLRYDTLFNAPRLETAAARFFREWLQTVTP